MYCPHRDYDTHSGEWICLKFEDRRHLKTCKPGEAREDCPLMDPKQYAYPNQVGDE